MGHLAKHLMQVFRARADAGRFTILPLTLMAAVPYMIAVSIYMRTVDESMRMPDVIWVMVVAKGFLAVFGPIALFVVWVCLKPPQRVRWTYDWMGGWLTAYAMAMLGAMARDLLEPHRLDKAGQVILGWSGLLWILGGTLLLLSGAVHFTWLILEERSERQRLEALMRFTRRITVLDFQTILDETVFELYRLLQAGACVLFLWSEEDQVLVPMAGKHDPSIYPEDYIESMMSFKFPPGFGLTGAVMESGEPLISQDVQADPRARAIPGYTGISRSSILAPLIVEGRKLGVVRLTRQGISPFTQDDLDLTMSFAGQAALLIEHGRVLKELSELSITDNLTGLYNARHFGRVLEREAPLALRHSFPLSLVMIDSDSLKQVNDQLGHPTGDQYLKEIGRAILESIRKTDFAFRYAGDEFLVLLPMTGPEMAMEVAERIRTSVAMLQLPDEVPRTISLGVATLPIHALDAEGLLAAADEAMYVSKRSGKNRTSLSLRSQVNASG